MEVRKPFVVEVGLTVLAAVAAAALCVGDVSSPSIIAQGQAALSSYVTTARGYIAISRADVVFIQWIDNHGVLDGSAQDVFATGRPPRERVSTRTLGVAGQIQGSQIVLSFNGGGKQFGTFSGNSLTVNFPVSSGQLAPVTFHQVSVSTYNSAIARLHAAVGSADSVARHRERIASEKAAIRAAATNVRRGMASLLATASSLLKKAKGLGPALSSLKSAVATTKSAAEQVIHGTFATTTGTTRCGFASTVAGFASTVAGFASTFAAETMTFSLTPVITGLKSAFGAFRGAEATLPSYAPSHPPTQADVATAIRRAQAVATSAVAIANRYINLANAEVDDAYGYAAEAYRAGSCGSAPVAPKPIPQIA